MKTFVFAALLLVLPAGALLLPLPGPSAVQTAAPAVQQPTGAIKGRVHWDGELPAERAPLTIDSKSAEGCCPPGSTPDATDRSLLLDALGGIANVVLTVNLPDLKAKPLEQPFVINQKQCSFEPRVALIPAGSMVAFVNSDAVNHNVRTLCAKNDAINKTMAGGGREEFLVTRPEVISVHCDLHPWMRTTIFATDDAVHVLSKADGSFELSGLPPGTYKLSWWHEALGKGKSAEITVGTEAVAFDLALNLETAAKGRVKK